ncbi:sensor histidine kinase [Faecalicatena contorta]|uniref:sensor histidine kinase n=1 Tax=Faecalicatena contorta TaxID=39482 RepID=UPI001F2A50A0|nr:HAMP domain-containing sensor histidine kinase [Faecalicatena contorta]MCF2554719.1 HAMP domain-containing histidine kinase [Faecalicatena contorta]MCF2679151.1 HAMP domain-containing histidine kinase [Faecalicatena contorta]
MKNNYRKLKFSILLQTVLVTALTVLVGGFLLDYVIDGVYNDSFAKIFVDVLTWMHVEEQTAIDLYWKLIGDNKVFFMIVGFLLLFALFFYIALSRMTSYLDQVGDGIENIVSESTEPIHLITELKPIEIRLNEIKATLKRQELESIESEKKKNDLVLFLAHDLKTPLTSIVAYLSMLDGHPDMPQEEREKYTHIALDKSIRLGELINEFFDITRYNLLDIELEPVEINLSMMLEQLADELYGVLQGKNLSCEVDVEENLVVYGDPDKLARVFDNILRNAIAYCYESTKIEIAAQMKKNDIEIVFTNRGDRIPGDMLQTIFEKFYRVDNARSSGTGGAGLGLAIAKEIVELHGGRIRAKSDDQKTQFIVTLPSKNKEEEGITNEIHTHRRRAFRSRTGHWKRTQRDAQSGDME